MYLPCELEQLQQLQQLIKKTQWATLLETPPPTQKIIALGRQAVQNDTWPLHCHINDPLWRVTINFAANQKVKHHKTQDILF